MAQNCIVSQLEEASLSSVDSLVRQICPMIRRCLRKEENYDLRMDTALVRLPFTCVVRALFVCLSVWWHVCQCWWQPGNALQLSFLIVCLSVDLLVCWNVCLSVCLSLQFLHNYNYSLSPSQCSSISFSVCVCVCVCVCVSVTHCTPSWSAGLLRYWDGSCVWHTSFLFSPPLPQTPCSMSERWSLCTGSKELHRWCQSPPFNQGLSEISTWNIFSLNSAVWLRTSKSDSGNFSSLLTSLKKKKTFADVSTRCYVVIFRATVFSILMSLALKMTRASGWNIGESCFF